MPLSKDQLLGLYETCQNDVTENVDRLAQSRKALRSVKETLKSRGIEIPNEQEEESDEKDAVETLLQ